MLFCNLRCFPCSLFWLLMSLEIIQVKLPSAGVEGSQFKIMVSYSTTSGSTALEWLSPEQTADKQGPFLFSQCEAIHCRLTISIVLVLQVRQSTAGRWCPARTPPPSRRRTAQP